MVHNLSPFLLQISGDFGIRWYGLSYLMGFIFAYMMFVWMARRQKTELNAELASDFIFYCALGTLIGGRLGYCLFYSTDLFLQFSGTFPFWGVLRVNEGGMASHGGMIGLVVGCFLFSRKTQMSLLYLMDLMCIGGPIGVFFGRVANFINGELVGRVASADFPLAVRFPQDIYQWPSHELSRLSSLSTVVAKIPELTTTLCDNIQCDLSAKWLEIVDAYRSMPGAREKVNTTLYRIVEAIQNGNEEARTAIGPLLDPRHPSQLYAAAGEGLFVFFFLFILWRKPRKPGVITATFITLYALVRIVDEAFRLPDAHLGFQWLELTRGQWLSAVMFIIGVTLLFLWGRRETLRTPGWRREANVRLHRK